MLYQCQHEHSASERCEHVLSMAPLLVRDTNDVLSVLCKAGNPYELWLEIQAPRAGAIGKGAWPAGSPRCRASDGCR